MIRVDFNVDKKDLYHFAWMLLFILATYIFANYIVMKDLDQYIEMKNKYNFQKTLQTYIQENAQSAKMKIANFKTYENYLTTMSQQYDEQGLRDLLSNYFSVEKIDKIEQKRKNKITIDHYLVTVSMKSPHSFFKFIDEIQKKALPFKIAEPIQFQKKGQTITVMFGLFVYTT